MRSSSRRNKPIHVARARASSPRPPVVPAPPRSTTSLAPQNTPDVAASAPRLRDPVPEVSLDLCAVGSSPSERERRRRLRRRFRRSSRDDEPVRVRRANAGPPRGLVEGCPGTPPAACCHRQVAASQNRRVRRPGVRAGSVPDPGFERFVGAGHASGLGRAFE
jgi:hypothetical protein